MYFKYLLILTYKVPYKSVLFQMATPQCICACLGLGILPYTNSNMLRSPLCIAFTGIKQITGSHEGVTSTSKLQTALSILPIYCIFINAWSSQHLDSWQSPRVLGDSSLKPVSTKAQLHDLRHWITRSPYIFFCQFCHQLPKQSSAGYFLWLLHSDCEQSKCVTQLFLHISAS